MKNLFLCGSRREEAQTNCRLPIADCRSGLEPRYPGCYKILICLAALLCAGNLLAADVASNFSAANELYAKGKFAEAAAIYENILQTGGQSPALLFNDGNAEFKAGHLGKAIAAYRRAELLAPRDAELRANLAFVRNQVQGATVRESRWQDWTGTLTLNEGALLAAVFFWVMFTLLAARQIRPALAPKLRSATRLAATLTIFSGAVLALQAANHFNSSVAVVTDAGATARSGPFDDAQSCLHGARRSGTARVGPARRLGAGRRRRGKNRLVEPEAG